jgi:hypothetical protein
MKRWATLTVLLYLLTLVVLTVPVVLVTFGKWWGYKHSAEISVSDAFAIYQEWAYWVWLAIMGLGQALLLLVPVGIARRRLPARRPLLTPIVTTAFLLANIFLWAVISVCCAIFKEKAFDAFGLLGELAWHDAVYTALAKQLLNSTIVPSVNGLEYIFGVIAAIAMLWLIWAVIFYFFARTDDPDALIKRATRWLLRGSILELLVAVPSHIIVRNRDTCCAPFGTFWGITTGLSIMLLCFGPGVFFLFAERFARLQPNKSPEPTGVSERL